MKNFLVISFGTFADFQITNSAVAKLRADANLILVSHLKHQKPDGWDYNYKYLFDHDPLISSDIDVEIISSHNKYFKFWLVSHPKILRMLFELYVNIQFQLCRVFLNHKIDKILILHTCSTFVLSSHILKMYSNIPIYVICYAPSIMTKSYPYPMDNIIKTDEITEEISLYSWRRIMCLLDEWSIIILNFKSGRDILNCVTYINCINPCILKRPLIPYDTETRMISANSILSETRFYDDFPMELNEKPFIYITFGSYGSHPILVQLIEYFQQLFRDYNVIYHSSNRSFIDTKRWKNYHSHIPYEWIVPKAELVVFTGTINLQTTCLYNAKPMIFIPFLGEQFLWAKNYREQTGTPFYSYLEHDQTIDNIRIGFEMRNDSRVVEYLKLCSARISTDEDAAETIRRIII